MLFLKFSKSWQKLAAKWLHFHWVKLYCREIKEFSSLMLSHPKMLNVDAVN